MVHVVWPAQASECDGFHKGGSAFLWEDVMLEDSDRAVCGVKDNELKLRLLGNRCLRTKGAVQQVQVLVHNSILVLRGKVCKRNVHRMVAGNFYVMHGRVAVALLNLCHWKVHMVPIAKREGSGYERSRESATKVGIANCFQIFEGHAPGSLGHGA